MFGKGVRRKALFVTIESAAMSANVSRATEETASNVRTLTNVSSVRKSPSSRPIVRSIPNATICPAVTTAAAWRGSHSTNSLNAMVLKQFFQFYFYLINYNNCC